MVIYCLLFYCRAQLPQFSMESLCVRHINVIEIEINVKSSIEEQKVREFLLSEKDFLRNEDLLCLLKLSHPNTRGSVSLLEKQNGLLRKSLEEIEKSSAHLKKLLQEIMKRLVKFLSGF